VSCRRLWHPAGECDNVDLMRRTLYWEQISLKRWTSASGYVEEENGTWTANLYRNQRTGKAWTERKTGFAASADARRWVEREAED